MMMDFDTLVETYSLNITGVVHCGAHLAEEADDYHRHGVDHVLWVEANPAVLGDIRANLSPYPHQKVVEALIWDADGMVMGFNVTNYQGMSSSVYPFGTHPEFSPDTVFVDRIQATTATIDTLVSLHWDGPEPPNMLVMDLQGAEGPALRGAERTLKTVRYVMTEVNSAEVYRGCTRIGTIDRYLNDFARVETHWVGDQGWGDALYVRAGALR